MNRYGDGYRIKSIRNIRFPLIATITAGSIKILSCVVKVTKISIGKIPKKMLVDKMQHYIQATTVSGGTTTPCFTTACLPIMAPGPITAPFSITAPPPIYALADTCTKSPITAS
jgi:hypothetical protein